MTEKELSERRAVLCEKYDKILGLTYHFGVADSDRDDVVQEVFVAAYLHLHQLRDIESMDSWLYKIAMRKAGRIGRKSKRREDKELLYESCEQELDRISAEEYASKIDFSDEDIAGAGNNQTPLCIGIEHGGDSKAFKDELQFGENDRTQSEKRTGENDK